jgi:hypothetical protein
MMCIAPGIVTLNFFDKNPGRNIISTPAVHCSSMSIYSLSGRSPSAALPPGTIMILTTIYMIDSTRELNTMKVTIFDILDLFIDSSPLPTGTLPVFDSNAV